MKIKTLKFSLLLIALISIVISCKDDDDDVAVFYEEDRTEQQAKDKDSLLLYLSTHYYNSGFFETGSDHKYTDIVIEELQEGDVLPEGHTLLIDAVTTHTTEYLDTSYDYYILNLNQGGGDSPAFTDIVRVRYEGSSINEALAGNDEVFDSSVTPADFNLQTNGFSSGVIKAWQLVMPYFNAAAPSDYIIDENGNITFSDFGLGVMFVPSGLAYFSGTATGTSYDNLMFKFELLQFEVEDHDNDGIPSYLEDIDGDLDVTNDDSDGDFTPDFIDVDDDGDFVLTIDELIPTTYTVNTNLGEVLPVLAANEFERSRTEVDGIITIKTVTIADSNNDGIPDYLDPNITINYNE
ncbi:FKBP-type peptidyl-prolyl cis-trans isomerase [Winogradskyella sp. PC D3.3]